jgi:hypothetical protein
MTSVIKGVVRGAALVTALAIFSAPAALAGGLTDPPQVRILPPGGVTATARLQPPVGITQLFLNWLRSRLSVPNG